MAYVSNFNVLFIVIYMANGFYLPNKIASPKHLHDRIAIIGAGPSGVHMAYLLKQRGFINVQVFEKSSRIGGKSCTIMYKGIPREMGSLYGFEYEYTGELMRKFLPQDMLKVNFNIAAWLDSSPPEMSYHDYILMTAMKTYGTDNRTLAGIKILNDIKRYTEMRKNLFGINKTYRGLLPPEPSDEVMHQIRGTFKQFVDRNNFQALYPIFYYYTMLGYERIEKVPALYGLMMNTFGEESFLLKQKNPQGRCILKRGTQSLWETIAEKEKLDITLNMNVIQMDRHHGSRDSVRIIFRDPLTKKHHRRAFDFLIWSPEMKTSLQLWGNAKHEEKSMFSDSEVAHYTTSLVTYDDVPENTSPFVMFFDNLVKKSSDFWMSIDVCKTDAIRKHMKSTNKHAAAVNYQMHDHPVHKEILARHVKEELWKTGVSNIHIKAMKRWRYFPRYSMKQIEKKVLWRILEMQGKHGMWYIGSSVVFECIDAVLHYNLLLIKNMETHKRHEDY